MDSPNQDHKKISALFRGVNVERAASGLPGILPGNKVLTQAPGISPMVPPRHRKKRYSKIQLDECIKLSREVGTEAACKTMGISVSYFYYYARLEKLTIGKTGKRRKQRLTKYTPEQLKKVVRQAMTWHANASQASSLRKCCVRAGQTLRINGHTAYNYYIENRSEFGAEIK